MYHVNDTCTISLVNLTVFSVNVHVHVERGQRKSSQETSVPFAHPLAHPWAL